MSKAHPGLVQNCKSFLFAEGQLHPHLLGYIHFLGLLGCESEKSAGIITFFFSTLQKIPDRNPFPIISWS